MELTTITLVVAAILMIACIAALPAVKNSKAQNRWEENNHKKTEERIQQEHARRYAAGEVIIEAKLLDGGTQATTKGGLGGALAGGMVAGPLGAVVGASSTKNGVQLVRFAVKYSDGQIKIKEVYPNGKEYQELMKYVKWEDLQ